MATNNHEDQQQPSMKKPLSSGGGRGRNNVKESTKKEAKRGLGVAKLEEMRMQQEYCLKQQKVNQSSSSSLLMLPPTHSSDHHPRPTFLHQRLPFEPLSTSGVCQCPHPQQAIIHGGNTSVMVGGSSWAPLLTPLDVDTSTELSSTPNLNVLPSYHLQHHFHVPSKKTRYDEENAKGSSNAKRNKAKINGPDFMGYYSPQHAAPNLVDGQTIDFFCNKPAADATHNIHDERKGIPMSGSGGFTEYEFLAAKDGRDTASKELQFPLIGSVAGEASPTTTTASTPSTNTATIDLSLKLSR